MASEEFSYELKIPRDRIAVIIGRKGEIKKRLQKLTKIRIQVDSKEGDITISGQDALRLFDAKEVIKAIGRGFNPEVAQLLLKQDYGLEIFNLSDYAKSKNTLNRLRGRVIGSEGKSREIRSAARITSRLCSIITTVCPASTSRCRTSSSRRMSSKCRPLVGSSRM